DPHVLRRTPMQPSVLIEGAFAARQPLDLAPKPELPPLTTEIQIDYTGFSVAAPGRLRFRYMLEGLQADWIDAGSRRQAFYTNLPPGSYRFHVIASSYDVSSVPAVWDVC